MKKSSVIASLVLALTSTNTALADPKPLGFELAKLPLRMCKTHIKPQRLVSVPTQKAKC